MPTTQPNGWPKKVDGWETAIDAAVLGAETVDATASKSGNTATITVTDREGVEHTVTVSDGAQGEAGQDGYSPSANVLQGDGSATITITDKDGTTTATVHDGADGRDGRDGTDGVDGFSPTARVERVEGGAEVTVTDASGTTTAMLYDAEISEGSVTTDKLAQDVTGGYFPSLAAGSADGILGGGPTDESAWLFRACPGTDGPASIESIKGKTVVWNQLVTLTNRTATSKGITCTAQDGKVTFSAPNGVEENETFYSKIDYKYTPIAGHKYIAYGTNADMTVALVHSSMSVLPNTVFTNQATQIGEIYLRVSESFTGTYECYPMLFDLTAMFGAGNEPSTVEEFEALFPEPYYEYDAGSLLSVNMEGVETNGFNQWDEQWEAGGINHTTGENARMSSVIRSKGYIPVIAGRTYYVQMSRSRKPTSGTIASIHYYDGSKTYLDYVQPSVADPTFTVPSGVCYMRFNTSTAYGATYNNDICINLSDPARNGEYEAYQRSQRAIPVSTYFPDGMRSAGRVYDELTEHEAITRVGAVTVNATNGTGGIAIANTGNANLKAFIFDSAAWGRMTGNAPRPTIAHTTAVTCNKLPTGAGYSGWTTPHVQLWPDSSAYIIFAVAEGVTTVAELNTWLASNPLTIHYELAEPTVTPIDPVLNLSYRVDDFGTERIMMDETADAPQTAPPTIIVNYGSTADGIRDRVLATIADPDGPVAQSNHAVGSYLTMGGTLYKVTTAIASGEAIVPGTNVTATTVMAEVLSLIQ